MCREFIAPKTRPNFFWIHDRFYSHFSVYKQDRFLHICIQNASNLDYYFMQRFDNWDEVAEGYRINRKKIIHDDQYNNGERILCHNPPILRVETTVIPDAIFDFGVEGSKEARLIFPVSKPEIFTFFDERHIPIPFANINGLVKLLPELTSCFPIVLENN
jgi:hypothetical protein